MKKTAAALVLALTPITVGVASAAPAEARECSYARVVNSVKKLAWGVDDDQVLVVYMQAYRQRNCLFTVQYGYSRLYSSVGLHCQDWRSLYVKPTNFRNVSIPGHRFPCRTWAGVYKGKQNPDTIRVYWLDPRGTGDRCTNAYFKMDQRLYRDPSGYTPKRCI